MVVLRIPSWPIRTSFPSNINTVQNGFVCLVLVFLFLTSYVTGHTFELTLKAKCVLNREVVRVVNLSWSFWCVCLEKMKDSDTKSAKKFSTAAEPAMAVKRCWEGQAPSYRTIWNGDALFPLLGVGFEEAEYFSIGAWEVKNIMAKQGPVSLYTWVTVSLDSCRAYPGPCRVRGDIGALGRCAVKQREHLW